MTDILFITPTEDLSLRNESNGTMLLTTKLLEAGFDARLLRFGEFDSYSKDYTTFIREITGRILSISPRCVSFYTLWPNFHVMLRIAQTIRSRNRDIIIVFGGPQASTTASATMEKMDFIDYVCCGEGENTVVPFFTAILRDGCKGLDTIPGLYYRDNGKIVTHNIEIPLCDLDTLPHWDKRLLLGNPEPQIGHISYFMPIDAGRGCPYSCTFCCTSYFWRRMYRLKSPERIVEDIRFFKENFGINSFWFSHDAFTSNQRLVTEVCDHLIESGLNIKWRCSSRVDCLTEELILKMKQAGLIQIELGIETGSPRMQKVINKRLNLDRAKEMIDCLLKNKIRIGLFFIYGFPQETEEDLNTTLEFMFPLIDKGVRYSSMSMLRFCPKTAMLEEFEDKLVFDPELPILFRGVFGWEEENPMILAHPDLFPYYYSVEDSLRRDYQYLHTLVELYFQFPHAIDHLRKLYKGDNLRFYRDFYENNLPIFQQGPDYPSKCVEECPYELIENTMKNLTQPCIPQLRGLFQFINDMRQIKQSKEDASIRRVYDFSYVDFKLNLPIEQYSKGTSEILLQKVNGVLDMKVLHIDLAK